MAACGGASCFSFCLVVRHPVSTRVSERLVAIVRVFETALARYTASFSELIVFLLLVTRYD